MNLFSFGINLYLGGEEISFFASLGISVECWVFPDVNVADVLLENENKER